MVCVSSCGLLSNSYHLSSLQIVMPLSMCAPAAVEQQLSFSSLHIVMPPTLPIEQLRHHSVPAVGCVFRCSFLSSGRYYGSFRVVVPPKLPIEQLSRWIAQAKDYVRRCGPVEQQTSF